MTDTQTHRTAVTVPALDLIHALKVSLVGAGSGDPTIPVLDLIKVVKEGDTLTFWATDRYMLSRYTLDLKQAEEVLGAGPQRPTQDFEMYLNSKEVKPYIAVLNAQYRGLPSSVGIDIGPDGFEGLKSADMSEFSEYPRIERLVPEKITMATDVDGGGVFAVGLKILARLKPASLMAKHVSDTQGPLRWQHQGRTGNIMRLDLGSRVTIMLVPARMP